jgi:hypothetical protein
MKSKVGTIIGTRPEKTYLIGKNLRKERKKKIEGKYNNYLMNQTTGGKMK